MNRVSRQSERQKGGADGFLGQGQEAKISRNKEY